MSLGVGISLAYQRNRGVYYADRLSDDILYAGGLRRIMQQADKIVRIRRSSDNSEQDFQGTKLDTGAITSFISGGSGYITTFYDQSGNVNAVETTGASQSQYKNSGDLHALVSVASSYAMTITAPTDFTASSVLSTNGVLRVLRDITGGSTGLVWVASATNVLRTTVNGDSAIITNAAVTSAYHVFTTKRSGTDIYAYVDGVLIGVGTVAASENVAYLFGALSADTHKFREVILLGRALNDNELLSLTSEQKRAWSI